MPDSADVFSNEPPVILVVDDDPAIRSLLAQLLTAAGFAVIEAADGKGALRHASEHSIDLTITDLVMPEQDGLETIRELRRRFPRIKVIAMSGYQGGMYLRHARLLGACATIAKPFSLDRMVSTVESVLAGEPVG